VTEVNVDDVEDNGVVAVIEATKTTTVMAVISMYQSTILRKRKTAYRNDKRIITCMIEMNNKATHVLRWRQKHPSSPPNLTLPKLTMSLQM